MIVANAARHVFKPPFFVSRVYVCVYVPIFHRAAYGQTSSFEAQYPDYPDYARYQTAKSGLSVEEPSPSTGVQRTDSIDQVLQSAQRDVISRYNSKQYQQSTFGDSETSVVSLLVLLSFVV